MGVKRSRDSNVWQTGDSECAGTAAAGGSGDPGWSSDSDIFDRQEYSDRLFSSSQGSTCTDGFVGSSSGGDGGDEPPPANTKRTQRRRITTEAHQRTVAMMMAASRELWTQQQQQQQNPEQNTLEEEEGEARQSHFQELQEEPAGCSFFQRAFW